LRGFLGHDLFGLCVNPSLRIYVSKSPHNVEPSTTAQTLESLLFLDAKPVCSVESWNDLREWFQSRKADPMEFREKLMS